MSCLLVLYTQADSVPDLPSTTDTSLTKRTSPITKSPRASSPQEMQHRYEQEIEAHQPEKNILLYMFHTFLWLVRLIVTTFMATVMYLLLQLLSLSPTTKIYRYSHFVS